MKDERPPLRRIIYESRAVTPRRREVQDDILAQSRRNNGVDGITGILWAVEDRYLQLLEGPPESVDLTYARIAVDARHHDVRLLSDSTEADRLFGDWAMAGLPGSSPNDAEQHLRSLLRGIPAEVSSVFC